MKMRLIEQVNSKAGWGRKLTVRHTPRSKKLHGNQGKEYYSKLTN